MKTYHFQLSGGIADGSFTLSQQFADDGLALAEAETMMRRSRIVQAATRMTIWAGRFGPEARCVAVYEMAPSVEFGRNESLERRLRAMRTPQ